MIAACDEGHLQVVRFLTQSGVDINQQTKVLFTFICFHNQLSMPRLPHYRIKAFHHYTLQVRLDTLI